MKIKFSIMPLFTVCAGVLGLIFRFWLDTAGTDKDGLVIPNHPSVASMFILAAATLLVVGLCALGVDKTPKPMPRSTVGAIGCFVAAAGILISDFIELSSAVDWVGTFSFIFGLAAAICFVFMGTARLQGRHRKLWAHVVIVVYFMLHLILQYRHWTSVPQLQNFFFPLLSSVFLMIFSYQRACKDLSQPGEQGYLFFSQAALFCCFLSMTGSIWMFYAAMILWITLDTFPVKGV